MDCVRPRMEASRQRRELLPLVGVVISMSAVGGSEIVSKETDV